MGRPFTKFSDKIYKTEKIDFMKINIINDITNNNLSMLKAGTLLMTAFFGLMFIMSFIFKPYSGKRLFYALGILVMGALLFAAIRFLANKQRATLMTVYSFVSIMYYYGAYEGVVAGSDNLAAVSCLFLGVLPLLFVDDISRIMLFTTVAAIMNIILMALYEPENVFIMDITNIIFSWYMGIYLSIQINRIRLKNFINEQEIIIERDTDAMTGLWNKNTLTQKISELIAEKDSRGAFFMMDLDHFKHLNDTFGHSYGDEILVETAKCVRSVYDDNAVPGRFGGDEFIFYVPNAYVEKAEMLAEKLLGTLYETIKVPTDDKGLHVSLGIAMYSYVPGMTYDKLMNMADRAMYVTKKGGRFGYTIFSEDNMERRTIKT